MTKDLYDKLMVFGNDQEPFLTHNFMRTTDLDDGTATVTLPMHTESLNRWGAPTAASCSRCAMWPWAWPL